MNRFLPCAISILLCILSFSTGAAEAVTGSTISAEGRACIECHQATTRALVKQWEDSSHHRNKVDCYSCHRGAKGDPSVFSHYGFDIAVIVSPKYCSQCHPEEAKQFDASHHAKATQFIGSLDNVLGEIVEGGAAAINGCRQCHGSVVGALKEGKMDPSTWPNSGIGRINPDGSRGTCAACHGRHRFSSAQARQPENCGKCHLGPDHPQIEIYNESKHGIQYAAHKNEMNLDSKSWEVGKDYTAAPTCATCHMGATSTQKVTHDAGARISWTLRPAISTKLENWEKKRDLMQEVCSNCHAAGWVNNFYAQYDMTVNHYNEKFAGPAKEIMDTLHKSGKLTATPFDERIEWTYYELWHHEGRRARMGTAMMGPDYTQWHGFFEVAKNFYNEFLPEVEVLNGDLVKNVLQSDYHKWKKGLTKEEIEKTVKFYQERYKQ